MSQISSRHVVRTVRAVRATRIATALAVATAFPIGFATHNDLPVTVGMLLVAITQIRLVLLLRRHMPLLSAFNVASKGVALPLGFGFWVQEVPGPLEAAVNNDHPLPLLMVWASPLVCLIAFVWLP